MILGVGIDIVEVARIRASFEKYGERFLQRILLPNEIRYCLSYTHPAPQLAARFAAKEAVSKAFGTGICGALGWHDIEVARNEAGQPFIVLHGSGRKLLENRQGRIIHLSISHTETYAAVVAIMESSIQPQNGC